MGGGGGMGRSVGRTASGWGRWGGCGRRRPRRTAGGGVEDELARGTASGAAVARLGLDVGWQFEGGHIPIGPPRCGFLLLCVCVGAARLGRKILKKSESSAVGPGACSHERWPPTLLELSRTFLHSSHYADSIPRRFLCRGGMWCLSSKERRW